MFSHARSHCSPHRHGGGGSRVGVRRPLRFLAYKLDLDQDQVDELARILRDLKTERAQAEVDDTRAISAMADAVGSEDFDASRAKEALDLRVEATRRVQEQVVEAFRAIHELLNEDQRKRLATLIRTGVLAL